jgi:nicotinate phosphoribosyltransferase
MTNPGAKTVLRFYDADGLMEADVLARGPEELNNDGVIIVDPNNPLRRKKLTSNHRTELLQDVVKQGTIAYHFPPIESIRARRADQLAHLHESHRRLHNPHEYKVGLTRSLWRQKEQMLTQETV